MNSASIRSALAYILLAVFVISTSIGGFVISLAAGFITMGVTSGVAGWLLGATE